MWYYNRPCFPIISKIHAKSFRLLLKSLDADAFKPYKLCQTGRTARHRQANRFGGFFVTSARSNHPRSKTHTCTLGQASEPNESQNAARADQRRMDTVTTDRLVQEKQIGPWFFRAYARAKPYNSDLPFVAYGKRGEFADPFDPVTDPGPVHFEFGKMPEEAIALVAKEVGATRVIN